MSDSNKESYDKVFSSLEKHHEWFDNSIPLIASENIPSPAVREAVMSDFGNRYAEGWPGERVYAGCTYIDEVEIQCMELAQKLFKAEFADVRSVSGVVANLAIYSAYSNPGDVMIASSIPAGGHISHGKKEHSGTAGLVHGLDIEFFAFDPEEMTLDVDKTKAKVEDLKSQGKLPKIAMFGGSVFLFPHPVKELAEFLKGHGMHINYDAAHVAGLIAGGKFQDPLREGTDTMTMSTHKTLFGPQGGLVIGSEEHAEPIKKAMFPGLTSSHHIHHMGAKAVAFAEALEFGKDYAEQTIKNAKALADSFTTEGLRVVSGSTSNHIVLVDTQSVDSELTGKDAGILLNDMGITLNRNAIPFDTRSPFVTSGIRMGTPAVTTCGMKEKQLTEVGQLISNILKNRDDELALVSLKDQVNDLAVSYQPYG